MGPGDSLIGYWGAFVCGGDGAGFQEVEHVVSQIIQRSRTSLCQYFDFRPTVCREISIVVLDKVTIQKMIGKAIADGHKQTESEDGMLMKGCLLGSENERYGQVEECQG